MFIMKLEIINIYCNKLCHTETLVFVRYSQHQSDWRTIGQTRGTLFLC